MARTAVSTQNYKDSLYYTKFPNTMFYKSAKLATSHAIEPLQYQLAQIHMYAYYTLGKLQEIYHFIKPYYHT